MDDLMCYPKLVWSFRVNDIGQYLSIPCWCHMSQYGPAVFQGPPNVGKLLWHQWVPGLTLVFALDDIRARRTLIYFCVSSILVDCYFCLPAGIDCSRDDLFTGCLPQRILRLFSTHRFNGLFPLASTAICGIGFCVDVLQCLVILDFLFSTNTDCFGRNLERQI